MVVVNFHYARCYFHIAWNVLPIVYHYIKKLVLVSKKTNLLQPRALVLKNSLLHVDNVLESYLSTL